MMENKEQKQEFLNMCEDCYQDFETMSKFRSICPACSVLSYEKVGLEEEHLKLPDLEQLQLGELEDE